MKRSWIKYLILALSAYSTVGYSQSNAYKTSNQIEKDLVDKPGGFSLQLAATDYAFQGNLKAALSTWNLQRPQFQGINLSSSDSLFRAHSQVKSAKQYIIERSKREEIIILNELHHNPSHRVFAASLLKDLYANGYRYLGLEALMDSAINERGFVVKESGFYTVEPEFANFVNEALAMGFKVFGYEATADAKYDSDNWKNREIAQAHNIHDFMKNNKEGKYFIYCGAGHAFEGNNNGRGLSMAGVLADLTKINPFTIDQNRYSYKGEARYNHPFSKSITANEPVVLVHESGEVFRSTAPTYETDISIIQPSSMFEGSVNYVKLLDPKRTAFKYDVTNIKSFPALIYYYQEKDYIKNKSTVPSGIIEVKSKSDQVELLLKPAKYTILVENP